MLFHRTRYCWENTKVSCTNPITQELLYISLSFFLLSTLPPFQSYSTRAIHLLKRSYCFSVPLNKWADSWHHGSWPWPRPDHEFPAIAAQPAPCASLVGWGFLTYIQELANSCHTNCTLSHTVAQSHLSNSATVSTPYPPTHFLKHVVQCLLQYSFLRSMYLDICSSEYTGANSRFGGFLWWRRVFAFFNWPIPHWSWFFCLFFLLLWFFFFKQKQLYYCHELWLHNQSNRFWILHFSLKRLHNIVSTICWR